MKYKAAKMFSSAGAKRERAYAVAAGKPVYEVDVMGEIEEKEI